jgi:hypothetical protein
VSCGDLLGHAAGDQLAQHRVEPARDLVLGPAQVPVPPGPHLQHRGVIIGADLAPGPAAQRRDRHLQARRARPELALLGGGVPVWQPDRTGARPNE